MNKLIPVTFQLYFFPYKTITTNVLEVLTVGSSPSISETQLTRPHAFFYMVICMFSSWKLLTEQVHNYIKFTFIWVASMKSLMDYLKNQSNANPGAK